MRDCMIWRGPDNEIHNVKRSWFEGDNVERIDFVEFAVGDMNESWDDAIQIQ